MQTTGLDYFIIMLYFVIILGVGFIGSRLAKNSDDYLVAGRNLPLWAFLPGLASVVLGGGATFGASKLGYLHGISASWMVIMYGLGIAAMGFLMSSKMSNLRVISLSEMLEVRYAKQARYMSATVSAFYVAMIAVLQVIAIGTVLHSLLGWSLTTSMLVGGGIALIYTIAGGMCSLYINDVIQFVLMTFGVFFILLPMGLNDAGGFAGLAQNLDPIYFNPVAIGWEKIFSWFLLFFLGLMIGQDIWQRVFTAKNSKVAKVGAIGAGGYIILWSLAMAMVGLLSVVLLPNLQNPQEALPRLIIQVVPTGLQGLVLAGVLSALLSTVSGTVLASSTLIYNDLVLPFKKELPSKKQEINLTRAITMLVGLAVLAGAILIKDVLTALDIAYAILSGSIFIPVVAGFFWKRANWQGALASIAASVAVIATSIAIYGSSSTKPIIYGILTSTIVLISVSLLTKPHSEEKMQVWQERIDGNCLYENYGNEKIA